MAINKKVTTFNECYSSNLGDQAISKYLNKYLINKGYEVNNIYLTNPRTPNLPNFSYALNPNLDNRKVPLIKRFLYIPYWYIRNKTFLKKQIQKSSQFIFGGGQLLISSKRIYPSAFAVSLFFTTYLITKCNKKDIYFIGVGAVKNYGIIEKFFYKKALKRADYIIVRDNNSREYLKTNFNLESDVMPDIAFYEPEYNRTNSKEAIIFVTDYNKIRLYCEDSFQHRNKYYEFLFKKLKMFQGQNLDVSLCYTTIEDANETYKFKEYLIKKKNIDIFIKDVQTLSELESVLRNVNLIYASRMHALILAKKNGCNFVSHNISDKIKSFTNDFRDRKNSDLHCDIVSKLDKIFDYK